MRQETGETRDAIIEDDEKQIREILYANRNRTEPYWIVIYAKPSKNSIEGKPVLVKHLKPYNIKPSEQVGMCIGEVCNKTGNISWSVNMPQAPFDFDRLVEVGGKEIVGGKAVIETATIPNAYLTR